MITPLDHIRECSSPHDLGEDFYRGCYISKRAAVHTDPQPLRSQFYSFCRLGADCGLVTPSGHLINNPVDRSFPAYDRPIGRRRQ